MNSGISSKVKALYIMGGNHLALGNATRCAEFNFWNDPEAAHIVLDESKCRVIICPWETCLHADQSATSLEWRTNVLASNDNMITKLMNPIDKNIHGGFVLCDAYLVGCFLMPHMVKSQGEHHVVVELAGVHTRGQMLIEQRTRRNTDKPNATVIKEIDTEIFKKFLLWICGHDGIDESEFMT